MQVNRADYGQLCRDASAALGIADRHALGAGNVVVVDGVPAQFIRKDDVSAARLYFELGTPKAHLESVVYQRLLELQGIFADDFGMFVRDAARRRLLFVARVPLGTGVRAEELAAAIRILVAQVRRWQATILLGCMAHPADPAHAPSRADGAQRT